MTINNWINNIQIGTVAVQTFTANGTYTPAAGMRYCIVECLGGGGASGGALATTATQYSVAGGGGGGGYIKVLFTAADIGASKAVVVGAGGTGVSGGSGNAGANTTFGSTLAVANGGSGGGVSAATTTSAGTSSVAGGSFSNSGGTLLLGVSGGRGTGGYCSATQDFFYMGAGGFSFYGTGGPAYVDDTSSGSSAGTGYGSAARGNSNPFLDTANTGTAGASGICIVTEFIS